MTARIKAGKAWRRRVEGTDAIEHSHLHGKHPSTRRCGTARSDLSGTYTDYSTGERVVRSRKGPSIPRFIPGYGGEPDIGQLVIQHRHETSKRRRHNRMARASRQRSRR